jgi:hypothetical protein
MATPPADDRFAATLRGFGPIGILAVIVIFAGNALVAHAAFNLTAYVMIYWNLESDVAHLVFK